jgi:dihydrolipoamide dehydrogenase
MVAEQIAGSEPHLINYQSIPSVIYTHPELATVGYGEARAKLAGVATKCGVFPFAANGRAKAANCADGFVKIITESETGKILGAQILGPSAGDLIHEICVAMDLNASATDLAAVSHAHPTYSEAVREAAMSCDGKAIHFI